MSICSIKFWELAEEFHKLKGRVVFRGDATKDEYGSAAVFQNLSASPTSIAAANANLAWGSLPGHKTTSADAVKAYVQADLKSVHDNWVIIPKELRPKRWKNFRRPACRLC